MNGGSTNGVLATGVWLPRPRLDLTTIAAVAGQGGGKGQRTVASYDEDTTTMAVEAARRATVDGLSPSVLWFATSAPAYADRTNATAIHAALGLDASAGAYDATGSVRAVMGAFRSAVHSTEPALVVASDLRTGLPGSTDEAAGGDGAAAALIGPATTERPALAEVLAVAGHSAEFVDRWRAPGEVRSKLWEERFGETNYVAAGQAAFAAALAQSGLDGEGGGVDAIAVAGPHTKAVTVLTRQLGADRAVTVAGVGHTGAAHPLLLLAAWLDAAQPGHTLALISLADGADVVVLRATEAVAGRTPQVAPALAAGTPVTYGRYLGWRGLLPVEPPRRPEPARVSSSAAARNTDWKFGFVRDGEAMAPQQGTIVTFTIDRLAYSPSPPIVFAVVDFDGGGRLPVELTDVDPAQLKIGDRVEPTFRRLGTSDGIHNYFWKVRPAGPSEESV